MNKFLLSIAFILLSLSSCRTQDSLSIHNIEKDRNFLHFFWKLQADSMEKIGTNGESFYKTIIYPLSEAESKLEGEIKHRIYLLQGEYGEYPDGNLYVIGDFYDPQVQGLFIEDNHVNVIIGYGGRYERKLGVYKLDISDTHM